MSMRNTWIACDRYGREVRRFTGAQSGMQARHYASCIGGSAHAIS
jgi:hypothetical protein